ncbi:hypothetical protein OSB04_002201 [Centaurea solstitialis]|uniref:Receptor-like serine/threonine-protein kinase n=1 Tax=Centaurea solstitialis TaxID=347529 RepID=A0AA38TSH8_9ASTR|nr:hypothetical protein OSB04_002201 [Centaurea solstitialis]
METLDLHGSTFIFFTLSLCIPSLSIATDTITPTQPLAVNQTLISSRQVFELGFFNSTNNNLYLGIWYRQVHPRTIVWVANRDAPINSPFGELKIAENGSLNLVDRSGSGSETVIWSSGTEKSTAAAGVDTVAQLLDSGNFVLRRENDENNYIWQSFDYPMDTLLPGMKLGLRRTTGMEWRLKSWRSDTDPGSGEYTFGINVTGFPEFLIRSNDDSIAYRSGPWNGIMFSGTPEKEGGTLINFEFHNSSDEIYFSFETVNASVYSRYLVTYSRELQRLTWTAAAGDWSLYWKGPWDRCDNYGECGPYGVCDKSGSPICRCMSGFGPRSGSKGCVRSSELGCGSDGFLELKNVKLPDGTTAGFIDERMNLSRCGEVCKKNCSCTGYANMYIVDGGSGCAIWFVDLMDIRQYAESESGGRDLYVRVAASDLGMFSLYLDLNERIRVHVRVDMENVEMRDNSGGDGGVCGGGSCGGHKDVGQFVGSGRGKSSTTENSKKGNHVVKIVAIAIGLQERTEGETKMDELELPLFNFTTLAIATNNFSDANELGQGGFGYVYKGTLPEGEVVAVKRLSRVSDQGIEELKNEVGLIAKLQHRNLVRLLGCCIEVEEKLLIYEYMENKSLNMFLFEKEKSIQLDWQLRLDIINGIARGLLYLHQDSRFKIIHRDLKASNILLDKKMNPKISDFGMARIFGSDQTEAKTKKVVGTYGYMSPEYAMDGKFSTKSDVFSFGVLVLEIVSGKKNTGSSYTSSELNLLGHTWMLWKEGKALELVDESVHANFLEDEALRCVQIGLLCVQEQAKERPSMSEVVLMLNSETAKLPQPKYPGFFIGKRHSETESSSKHDDSVTTNEVTITMVYAR